MAASLNLPQATSARWALGRLGLLLLALPVLLPLLFLLAAWQSVDAETWQHLIDHVLARVLGHTLLLCLGVVLISGLLGAGLAALVVLCEFPGRRHLDWALVLPMALPTYVIAFVYVGLTEFGGPAHNLIRLLAPQAGPIDLRHPLGAALLFGLVLYPYVYLLVRAALVRQGAALLEAARTLGMSPARALWRVVLPALRPALAAGLALALMETLADFGAVSILGVETFTTTIYKTWFGLYQLPVAAQLSTLLVTLVILLLALERFGRGRARYTPVGSRPLARVQLRGARAVLALIAVCLPLLLALVLPLAQLLLWAAGSDLPWRPFAAPLARTIELGLLATSLVVLLALLGALLERRRPQDALRGFLGQLGRLGYALPGTVLAVGLMLALLALDRALIDAGLRVEPLLSGGLLALLLALVARFLRVAHGPLETALAQLRPELNESARLLGASPWQRITRLHLPLLRPGLASAALLVLVDVMKEMPATLMLRPFGWDTLAVRIYGLTSEGMWAEAALPALILIAVGLLPVWLLFRGAGGSVQR